MVEYIVAFLVMVVVMFACGHAASLIVVKIFRLIGKQDPFAEEAPKTSFPDFMQIAAIVLMSVIFVGLSVVAMRIINAFTGLFPI